MGSESQNRIKDMDAVLNAILVEDNPGDAFLMTELLGRSSLRINLEHLKTLQTALDATENSQFDIAFLDLGLPDSNGLDTVKTFHRRRPSIPTIVLTGFDDDDFAVQALQLGAKDYLIKGTIDVETVTRAIRYALFRQQTEKQLAESIKLLEFAIDQMPVPVVLSSAGDEKIIRVNQPARELMIKEPEDITVPMKGDERLKYWKICQPDGTPYKLDELPLTKAIRNGTFTKNREVMIERSDGPRWVSASAAPLFNDKGEVVAGILVFPEITELKQAQEALLESEKKINQYDRLEAIGRLAGGIAHDFNNLLTVIASFAEFGIEDVRDEDPLKADLRQILDAANRGANLSRQLLAFSKKQVLEPEYLNINQQLKELEKLLLRIIGESIELQTTYDENLKQIHADPAQIDQVLMNLVVNARDAMPQGGRLTICTSNETISESFASKIPGAKAGKYICIRVADSGMGMNEETQKRVFEPFFTTKSKDKGTGLGLSTVYGIVEQSNGIIVLESVVNKGTTFRIYFPVAEGEQKSMVSRPPAMSFRKQRTILIVEDDSAVRLIAQRILVSAGHNVVVAANGGEAIIECERIGDHLDLILTDVIMPKMDGTELVTRISKICPSAAILYMSGYASDDLSSKRIQIPPGALIAKPFRAKELLSKIDRLFS